MNRVVAYFENRIRILSDELQALDGTIRECELKIQSIDEKLEELEVKEKDSTNVFLATREKKTYGQHTADFLQERQQLLESLEKLKLQRTEVVKDLTEIKECKGIVSYSDGEPKFFDENYGMEFVGTVNGLDILKIQERERERIAADIHDSVVQKLTVLVHKSEFCSKVIDSDKTRVKVELDMIQKVTRECISELRDVIYDMHPMELKDLGFRAAIVECVEQLQHTTDMNIQLNIPDKFRDINEVIGITFVRNLKELCTNCIKHSKGENIYIKMFFRGNRVYLDVTDDGIGIEKERREKSGFGLSMIRERVALLNGKMTYTNNKDGGSCFKISLPIE